MTLERQSSTHSLMKSCFRGSPKGKELIPTLDLWTVQIPCDEHIMKCAQGSRIYDAQIKTQRWIWGLGL